ALAGEQDLRKMGGLKNELPITYWTFLIGAIAISGVPFFAGFYSKDEILAKTFESGHSVLWLIGLFTAMLTACYMFRLVYLAFFGERVSGTAHDAPGTVHDSHLHDAPPAMALALIVLAIGSVARGYSSFGGRFEHFLEPSFHGAAGEVEAAGHANEILLMGVSIVAAFTGIGIATYLFLLNRRVADGIAERFSGVHRLLTNKYY